MFPCAYKTKVNRDAHLIQTLTMNLTLLLVLSLALGLSLADHAPQQQQGRRGRVNNNAFVKKVNPAPVVSDFSDDQSVPVVDQSVPVVARGQQHQQVVRQGKQQTIPGAEIRSNAPDENGNYDFTYSTDDGVTRQESGSVRSLGGDESANEISGSVSWTSPEGQLITLNYIANENGYQPTGGHLPVAPPVSPAIQRGLDLIERNQRKQEQQQG